MLNHRRHLPGLFAVLLALMAQLAMGASVPRIDPVAVAGVLCHTDGDTPSNVPGHSNDCLICPLCVVMHTASATLAPATIVLAPPGVAVARRTELPPPSTAPPAPHRPPSQPRAPPTFS